jgi:hypothetical protein
LPEPVPSPAAGIFEGIIDQIHDRARQEVLFAERHRPAMDLAYECDACGLRRGILEFNDIADDGGERHRREGLPSSPGFGFGDLQQIVQHLDQLVDLPNGKPCRPGNLPHAFAGAERLLEPATDAPQRGSEIMRNRVGYAAKAGVA